MILSWSVEILNDIIITPELRSLLWTVIQRVYWYCTWNSWKLTCFFVSQKKAFKRLELDQSSRREHTTPSSGKNSGNSTAACSCSIFFRPDLDRDISSRDTFLSSPTVNLEFPFLRSAKVHFLYLPKGYHLMAVWLIRNCQADDIRPEFENRLVLRQYPIFLDRADVTGSESNTTFLAWLKAVIIIFYDLRWIFDLMSG